MTTEHRDLIDQWADEHAAEAEALGDDAMGLLSWVALRRCGDPDHPDYGLSWERYGNMAKRIGVHSKTEAGAEKIVQRLVKKLVDAGFVTVERQAHNGKPPFLRCTLVDALPQVDKHLDNQVDKHLDKAPGQSTWLSTRTEGTAEAVQQQRAAAAAGWTPAEDEGRLGAAQPTPEHALAAAQVFGQPLVRTPLLLNAASVPWMDPPDDAVRYVETTTGRPHDEAVRIVDFAINVFSAEVIHTAARWISSGPLPRILLAYDSRAELALRVSTKSKTPSRDQQKRHMITEMEVHSIVSDYASSVGVHAIHYVDHDDQPAYGMTTLYTGLRRTSPHPLHLPDDDCDHQPISGPLSDFVVQEHDGAHTFDAYYDEDLIDEYELRRRYERAMAAAARTAQDAGELDPEFMHIAIYTRHQASEAVANILLKGSA